VVAASLREAEQERSAWTKRIESESYAAILRDPVLMGAVRQTGRTLFGDNCAACHGAAAKGNKGFPNLTSGAWLWGGTPDAIAETIRVGINSTHPKTRVAQMPAFGRDQILKSADIEDVLAYLSSLGQASVAASRAGDVAKGKVVFTDTCAVCHGDDARGKQDVGSPDLTDAFWIYGGDAHSVYDSIWWGRQGHMPTWEGRLTSLERRILTLYVTDLQGKR
jgi:cytochrome c oxidase cbb3-type subunit 3